MPIKPEEALEVFGQDVKDLDKFDTPEAFAKAVEQTWIKRESAHNDKGIADKVFGKVNRGLRKELTDLNDSMELGLEDIDTKNPIEVIKSLPDIFKPRLDKIAELETKLKTAAPADVVEKFEQEKKELDKKLKAFEKNAKEWEGKYTELDTKIKTNDRTSKINGEWDGAINAIPFAHTVGELVKEGFKAKAKSKYQVLIDDEGKTYAANEKGEPLMNPKKAAERWSLTEALKAEADSLKLIGVNPQGGKTVPKPTVRTEREEPVGRFGVAGRRPPAARLQ